MGDFGWADGEDEGETWAKDVGGELGVRRGGESSSEMEESEPARGRAMGMGFDLFAAEEEFWLSLMLAMMRVGGGESKRERRDQQATESICMRWCVHTPDSICRSSGRTRLNGVR